MVKTAGTFAVMHLPKWKDGNMIGQAFSLPETKTKINSSTLLG